MHNSISIFVLPIFLLNILASTPISAKPTYIYTYCPNTTLFATNSQYQSNLDTVLSSLSSNATHTNGFYSTTSGVTNSSSTVYGLYSCRGDTDTTICNECVQTAAKTLPQNCPKGKIAVIWYDECLIRYSNESFFGELDDSSFRLPMYSPQNITTNVTGFNQVLGSTLNKLRSTYATKKATFTSLQTIYAMGQCTQDLSTSDCDRCLTACVGIFPSCCSSSQGARILFPSCDIRYEIYPFFQTATTAATTPRSHYIMQPVAPCSWYNQC